MNKKQKIGLYGEELAEKFFLKKDYKILEKRFQTRFGEIDLIIGKGEVIVFVEVKTRTSNVCGLPEESVNFYKINYFSGQYQRQKKLSVLCEIQNLLRMFLYNLLLSYIFLTSYYMI